MCVNELDADAVTLALHKYAVAVFVLIETAIIDQTLLGTYKLEFQLKVATLLFQ